MRPPKSESKRSQTVKRKEHSKSFAQKIVSTFSRPRGRKEEKEESEKFFVIWQSGKMLTTTKTGLSDNNNNMEVTGNGKTSARSIGYGSLCPSYDRGRILNLNEARLEPIEQTNFQFKSTYAQFR